MKSANSKRLSRTQRALRHTCATSSDPADAKDLDREFLRRIEQAESDLGSLEEAKVVAKETLELEFTV
jgi:hypothetical protein